MQMNVLKCDRSADKPMRLFQFRVVEFRGRAEVSGAVQNVESAYCSARDRAHSAPLGKACMSLIISVIELHMTFQSLRT